MDECQKTVLFSPRSGTTKEVLLAFFHFFPSEEKLKKKKKKLYERFKDFYSNNTKDSQIWEDS